MTSDSDQTVRATRAALFAERPHPQPQPARRPAFGPGDAHFFLQALAFARRLEHPVDGFGSIRIADEHTLNRPHVIGIGRVDEIEIGRVGVNNSPIALGNENAVSGLIDHGFDQRVGGLRRRQPQNARRKRKQGKHADRGEQRQEPKDIWLGVASAQRHETSCSSDQEGGNEQDQNDTAAARPAGAAVDRFARAGGEFLGDALGGHRALFLPCTANSARMLRAFYTARAARGFKRHLTTASAGSPGRAAA